MGKTMVNEENVYVGTLHENYNAMLQWVVAFQHGNNMASFLERKGYKKIAVYGMNDIGNCLVREIIRSDELELLYTIDQGNPKLYFDVKCFKLDDIMSMKKPDIIIVALPYLYEKIKDEIREKTNCNTVSVTEIVYEMDL